MDSLNPSPWLPALLGFLAGVLGSLFAPWVQWTIEKRRSKLQYRRDLVKTWREAAGLALRDGGDFRGTAAYSSLRPHLDPQLRALVEDPYHLLAGGNARPGDAKHHMILDDIARIEKEWGLL